MKIEVDKKCLISFFGVKLFGKIIGVTENRVKVQIKGKIVNVGKQSVLRVWEDTIT